MQILSGDDEHSFRTNSVHKPLQQSYEDPFGVTSRHYKTLKFDRLGRIDTVGNDRFSTA